MAKKSIFPKVVLAVVIVAAVVLVWKNKDKIKEKFSKKESETENK